ncbi:MAG: amidohydrolase [Gemmatimonadota bacterium]
MRTTTCRLLTLGALAACGCSPSGTAPADQVFVNGHVITVDSAFSVAEAFAVHQGRFVSVGTEAAVRAQVRADAPVIDLQGRTVLPGFNDNHIHLGPGRRLMPWRGGLLPGVPEWLEGVSTPEALAAALTEQATHTPPGAWIQGALNRPDWPNDRVPSRWDLDRMVPDHPVMLTRGPHTYLLNSRALALAGIDRTTPDPEGGWIFKRADGEPNGRVLEAARRLVDRVLPRGEDRLSYEEGIESMREMLTDLAGLGITSVNAAGIRPAGLRQVQDLYDRYGALLPRATVQLRVSPGHDSFDDPVEGVRVTLDEIEALGVRTGWGSDRLKLGALKMSIDGGLSAPVFWSLEDYPGRPGFRGAIRIPAETFRPVAERAHELGWQLGIHTMGDGAVQMVVDEIAAIQQAHPRADARHYLHHVAVKPPEATIATMARAGIMVASQPAFTVGLGAYAHEALSPEREQTQNPTRSLLDAGVRVSYGSDSAPYGPLLSIWTAVTRRGYDGQVYGPEEAVSVEDAIRLHTVEPAYFTFDETDRGSIAAGLLADFIVLSDDILTVPADSIPHLSVLETWVGGVRVHPSQTR